MDGKIGKCRIIRILVISDIGFERFWILGILMFGNLEFCRFFILGTLGIMVLGDFKFWELGSLKILYFGDLGLCIFNPIIALIIRLIVKTLKFSCLSLNKLNENLFPS